MTVAATRDGMVRGAEIADGVLAWRGIPYARPPIGTLRFRPPEPPQPWAGVRDALEYGNRSLQGELRTPAADAPRMDEDCLYLNVTAPAGAAGGAAGRPVLFWVHGGGFEAGDAAQAAGDGAAFARSHGIVVVTVNYRLGALGFLDVPGEHPTGAAGLHDQIAALRWTRENIAAFGGDPDRITIYGLSAGGKSVTNLLASPLASGLIARAAESSGGDHVKDLYALLAADGPRQADRVLAGYFGQETAAKILADYAARYPDLNGTVLRTAIMTDERYVTPTERLADAQAVHAPVWRSRYDGPYTGLDRDPDPAFAQYAPLLIAAHGGDGFGVWQGGDDLSAALHNAWGAFATTGDPGWAAYTSPDRPTMIFAPDGPRVEADPFAPVRAAWSGLTWQPGPWWAIDGLT